MYIQTYVNIQVWNVLSFSILTHNTYIYCGGLRRVLYFVFVQNATRGKIIDIPTVMHIFPSHHSFFSMSRKLMAKNFDNMISRHNLVYNN